ncbi:SH3 domain-containing protein [Verticillium dahliae VdLs.17]|uniref:SH3 domain-containing protein n=1 Tax=Verticillium dahliae (strain VdLs.17 / ATCC MYA-4575 / FGSC 10137) TaxID=498257 RepID=G2XC01_VERDV|nr:SH3 domain-containing protein [Verticillium dahliae VdLs.17]EGY16415.1 SH3 domain-containing protein [Verticillium dahliae VdLs.17]
MSSNPEKPPLSGQVPDQNQEPYYPTPAASGLPPAGFGQPTQSSQQPQQPQQSDLPPAYPSNEQHAAPTEKGAAVPASQTTQQNAPYFPPPPPGPPPTHTDTGLTAASSNPSQFYKSSNDYEGPAPPLPGPRPSQQGVHDEKTVPTYNSAQPHFAPPPGQAAAAATASDHHHQHQQPPAYATNAPSSAAPGAVAADGKKPHRSWGDRLAQMGSKAAIPINALANKMGSQSFLPTTMDRECEKAAQILKSFCKEGITSDHVEEKPLHEVTTVDPKNKEKEKAPRKRTGAIVKIPSKVIAKAQGLAIFTTARVGFQFSGATGSGVLIARRADGSWSPPSGIQVHALGAGFMIGVDIYDCVCVINTQEALKAFMSTRVSLGPDVAVTAGPYGAGGVLDFEAAGQASSRSCAADVPPTGAWMARLACPSTMPCAFAETQPAPARSEPAAARHPVPAEPQVAHGPIATGQTPVVGQTQGVAGQHVHDPATHGTGSQYGGPPHMSGAGGAAGADEALPGYVDDGVKRPGVGDQKFQYQ